MKTKIIYISGSEIFDMHDIRAAFEEVRAALNLDKTTVLFGVPVDAEDAGIATEAPENIADEIKPVEIDLEPTSVETIVETITTEFVPEENEDETNIESVVEQPAKKRGRPRKEEKIETILEKSVEPEQDLTIEINEEESTEPQVVPILSVLGVQEEIVDDVPDGNIEIIPDISEITPTAQDITDTTDTETVDEEDDDARLEKLLSAMKPLEEDVLEEQNIDDIVSEADSAQEVSFDATLEQLATEFIENQDKIAAEAKQTSRSKIGKLRNILPFKQSKHKDSGLGDLFGWAGIAANDEDFSVPGFFTSTAAKK